jgi:phage recombination protein Bet
MNAPLVVVDGEARRWEDHLELVRRMAAPGSTDEEFELLLYRARVCGLDPLARHIHLMRRGGEGFVVVGVDGLRMIADRTGAYAGSDDIEFVHGPGEVPLRARATVYKSVSGLRCAFTATARWDEFYPGDDIGGIWRRLPHMMLGKCAEAQALRKAFPVELAGLVLCEELGTPPPAGGAALPVPEESHGIRTRLG